MFQGQRSIFSYRSVSLVSALCAAAVVLFVIMAENAQSIKGAAFIFVLTSSIICPTIFIIANKKMRRHTGKTVWQFFTDIKAQANNLSKKNVKKNRIEPSQPPPQNDNNV